MIACRKSFTDTLLSLARMDKDIIAVTTDARGSVTLNDLPKNCRSNSWSVVLRSRMLWVFQPGWLIAERKCLYVVRLVFMWLVAWNR